MIIGQVIDLSRTISKDMPVYPGTEQPVISDPCTIDGCGFAEKKITLYSHTGTHIDAPSHILKGSPCLEDLGAGHFIGNSAVIELRPNAVENRIIELDDLLPFKELVTGKQFILLHTGWGDYWGRDEYFKGYPVLSADAAEWLAGFNPGGIGIDMISIDPPETQDMKIHKIFLRRNIVIIENLSNLSELTGVNFIFCCFPLKLKNSDGSPVRAIAVVN